MERRKHGIAAMDDLCGMIDFEGWNQYTQRAFPK
jgi:hypothetical protein